jgi:hypothetical protein
MSFSDMCGTFSAVGQLVPWDVLCHGTFCAVGRLEMGHFESRTFCAVGHLVIGPLVMGPLVMGRF